MVMVHVGEGKSYFVEKPLARKLEHMIKRMEGTDDNLLLIDGDEGQGKTNMAAGVAGYVSVRMGRSLTNANIFFDLDKLIDFAVSTKEQIIWWDEGALGGLAAEWWKKNQIKFTKLLMVARKRKHFFIICIPKFFKLNEYLVVDRSIGLINVYSRRNLQKGRYMYFDKSRKAGLYDYWKRRKIRAYWKFKSLRGGFPIALPKVVDEELYDKAKDEAILSIGNDAVDKTKEKYIKVKAEFAKFIIDKGYVKDWVEYTGKTKANLYQMQAKVDSNPSIMATVPELVVRS